METENEYANYFDNAVSGDVGLRRSFGLHDKLKQTRGKSFLMPKQQPKPSDAIMGRCFMLCGMTRNVPGGSGR